MQNLDYIMDDIIKFAKEKKITVQDAAAVWTAAYQSEFYDTIEAEIKNIRDGGFPIEVWSHSDHPVHAIIEANVTQNML